MTILGSVTIPDVISFDPCNSDSVANIELLFAGREAINVFDVLDMQIPLEHKMWLILRPELIDQEALDLIKEDFLVLMTDHENVYYERAVTGPVNKIVNKFVNYSNQTFEELENIIVGVILNRINHES